MAVSTTWGSLFQGRPYNKIPTMISYLIFENFSMTLVERGALRQEHQSNLPVTQVYCLRGTIKTKTSPFP